MKAYRANRSFGALQQGDYVEFEDDSPVLEALLGTGYLDPLEEPGIKSEEKFGVPTVIQEDPDAPKVKSKD